MIKNQTIKNDKGGNFIETVNFNSFHTKVKGKLNKCQVLICQLSSLLSLLMIYPNQGAGLHFNSSSLFISQSILHDAYIAHPCLLVKPPPHQKIFLVQLSAKLAPRPPFCQNLLIHFIFCNPRQPLIRTWNKSYDHMVYFWKLECAKALLDERSPHYWRWQYFVKKQESRKYSYFVVKPYHWQKWWVE